MNKRVKAEDFIDSQFGELTVNEVFKKNDRSYCKYTCSCGEQTIVCFSNLRTGNTSSCRKHRVSFFYKNLLNQKFGKLTPIEKTNKRKKEWKDFILVEKKLHIVLQRIMKEIGDFI